VIVGTFYQALVVDELCKERGPSSATS